jgi:hypothetical protein
MPKRYCAKDPPIGSAGLKVSMRSQGEAEIAIEQGETWYEGVAWTTRRQIVANRLIPLSRTRPACTPTKVIAPTNEAVAAAAQLDPQRYEPISQARSSRVSRTLSRGPSDHSPAKTGARWALR